jgi:DNA-binding MltR family transcriptional regulator
MQHRDAVQLQYRYPHLVSSASRKLLKESPTQWEMMEILAEMHSASDQVVAITGMAYLENMAEQVLRAIFVPLEKEDDARMFDAAANAILGPMSSKIRVLYALGQIDSQVYSDLLLMNHIRNAFAHSLHRVHFDHPLVAADCERLVTARFFFLQSDIGEPLRKIKRERGPKAAYSATVFGLYTTLLGKLVILGKAPSPDSSWPDRSPPQAPQMEEARKNRVSQRRKPRTRRRSPLA